VGSSYKCAAHGGGLRCSAQGCLSSAKGTGSDKCIAHGGGNRCSVQGCPTNSQSAGKCGRHRSQCSEQGCKRYEAANTQGKCRQHATGVLPAARATSSLRRPDPLSSDLPSSSSAQQDERQRCSEGGRGRIARSSTGKCCRHRYWVHDGRCRRGGHTGRGALG
jgi:hypothetical protein